MPFIQQAFHNLTLLTRDRRPFHEPRFVSWVEDISIVHVQRRSPTHLRTLTAETWPLVEAKLLLVYNSQQEASVLHEGDHT